EPEGLAEGQAAVLHVPERVEQDGRYRGHARDAVDSTVLRDEKPEPGAEDEEAQGAPDEERVAVPQREAAEKRGVPHALVGPPPRDAGRAGASRRPGASGARQ